MDRLSTGMSHRPVAVAGLPENPALVMMNGLLVNVCISRTFFLESLANNITVYHQYTIHTQFIEQNQ